MPIGTGPFKFVSYTPGDRLVLTRNADYFEPGMPKLRGVELRIIPEMSVKIAALEAGDIDVFGISLWNRSSSSTRKPTCGWTAWPPHLGTLRS